MNGYSPSTGLALTALMAMFAAAESAAQISKSSIIVAQNTAPPTRVQAGVLACKGEGSWGLIIAAKRAFRCTFSAADGELRGEYRAVIREFRIDVAPVVGIRPTCEDR